MLVNLVTNYLPPIWQSLDTIEDDVPELSPGMLVEWTRPDDYNHGSFYTEDDYEPENGIGIIKFFATERFYDYDTGKYVNLPCAYVTNANPADPYGYYIPMTHLDPTDLATYIAIYKDEYEPSLQEVQAVRVYAATKMQKYGFKYGHGDVSRLFHHTGAIPFPAIGGAK